MTDWAPPDEGRSKASRYVRIAEWKEHQENKQKINKFRFRLLEGPLWCYTGWSGGKPVRNKKRDGFDKSIKWDEGQYGKNEPKLQAVCAVLDVDTLEIKVWEIGQSTIYGGIGKLNNSEWGDATKYDIVCRKGKDKDGKTVYDCTVHPDGKYPLPEQVLDQWAKLKEDGFDLERLVEGGDPFPAAGATSLGGHAEPDGVPF